MGVTKHAAAGKLRALIVVLLAAVDGEVAASTPQDDRSGAAYPASTSVVLAHLGREMLVNCVVDDAVVSASCRRMLEARMTSCAAGRPRQLANAAAKRAESISYLHCLMPVPICNGVEVSDPGQVVERCVARQTGTSSAAAPRTPARMRYDSATRQLRVAGWIDKAFSQRLDATLARIPGVRIVMIESGGGYAKQADAGARLLNARGIAVRVDRVCASACVSLWANADARQLGPVAQIGLHDGSVSSSVPRFLQPFVHAVGSWATAAALRNAGFSEALIARGQATPNGDVLWLGRDQLRAAGVRFQAVD
jgi:hypothetical protein